MLPKDKNLYYVGGVVRDEILGKTSIDIDLCYEGDAVEFAKNSGMNIVKINDNLRTVRVLIEDKEIDIASTRREVYPNKGHLPKIVEIGCPLEEDLKRRDFTINAIAKRTTDGKVIDIVDGIKDIENKMLRVLHSDSFIDDPTRIIRGLKFSERLGFSLSDDTKNLQEEYLNNINYDMSYHRLKCELVDTFNLNKAEIFNKFVSSGMYKLLGTNNQKELNFNERLGYEIEQLLHNNPTPFAWLVYLSFFNLSKLELTRPEKRILSWADKLETQSAGNNTPQLSILIYNLRKVLCQKI